MNVHGRGVSQEAVNGDHVQILPPTFDRRASEDYLRHVLFTDEFRGGAGNVFPFQLDDLRTQALRELNVGVDLAARAIRYCALGFELKHTAMRSRTGQGS